MIESTYLIILFWRLIIYVWIVSARESSWLTCPEYKLSPQRAKVKVVKILSMLWASMFRQCRPCGSAVDVTETDNARITSNTHLVSKYRVHASKRRYSSISSLLVYVEDDSVLQRRPKTSYGRTNPNTSTHPRSTNGSSLNNSWIMCSASRIWKLSCTISGLGDAFCYSDSSVFHRFVA